MTEYDNSFLRLVNPYVEQLHQTGEPYVWRLKLSKTAFKNIEDALGNSMDSHPEGTRYLLSDEFAPCVMVYIAEWYKRCYENPQSRSKIADFESTEWRTIWEHCGFRWEQYVYQQDEGGTRRWLDSLYALGGLAIPFRLNQNCNALLLKLCRLYNKEDVSIEELSRVNGSIAFRQSIINEHSLHSYFECVLSGKPPYDDAELKNPNSDCSLLIKAIKDADKKVRQEKFHFEWLIRNVPEREHMQRRLKISLKPEEIGGKYRQYLSYDRLRSPSWGILHPENISKLLFSLQFEENDNIVKGYDFENPLLVFYNRGVEENNFVCWGTADEVIESHVPAKSFTKVQLWVKTDNEAPKPVPTPIRYNELLQVFRRKQDRFEWETKTNSQADTAVLFSDKWHEVTVDGHLHLIRKAFYDREEGVESKPYNWCNVFERIELSDGRRSEVIDCRKGTDYVFPTCYPNEICYEDGFTVERHYKEQFDEDDEEGEMMVEIIPILFGKDNLKCIHFDSNDDTVGHECNPYFIEHKVGNRYEIVENENDLNLGVEKLRVQVTENSLPITITVFYVPWSEQQGCPVIRDFENNEARIGGITKENDYVRDHREKNPCIDVKIGTDDDYAIVNVYRPQDLVELYQNNKLIEYYDRRTEDIKIPLILCKEFRVRDYGVNGVNDYHCEKLMSLYHQIFPLNNTYGRTPNWKIQSANEIAPFSYLHLCFFDMRNQGDSDWYIMDFMDKPKQIESNSIAEWRGSGIIFDSLYSPFCRHCHEMIEPPRRGLGNNRPTTNMSSIEIFDIAAKHRAYYFMFWPLCQVVRDNRVIDNILLPIISRSENGVSDQEVRDLQRFAFEFNFRWADKWAEWNGDINYRAQVNDTIYRITTLE